MSAASAAERPADASAPFVSGDVCWFSSAGPTVTGIPKPEISAPGAFHAAHMHWRWGDGAIPTLLSAVPEIKDCAWSNRGFHQRAAAWIARQGVKQFIDIGSGLPTIGNTHEVVKKIHPEARVVYVDNDPMVELYSQTILDEGSVSVLCADLREPEAILGHPAVRALLESGEPIGLLMTAVLMFYTTQYSFGGGSVGLAALSAANSKASLAFVPALTLGIMCNALVCLAAWMCYGARTTIDRVVTIVPPIAAFVAAGFEHCIANIYYIPFGLFIKAGAPDSFCASIGKRAADFPSLTWTNFLRRQLATSHNWKHHRRIGNGRRGLLVRLFTQAIKLNWGKQAVSLCLKRGILHIPSVT